MPGSVPTEVGSGSTRGVGWPSRSAKRTTSKNSKSRCVPRDAARLQIVGLPCALPRPSTVAGRDPRGTPGASPARQRTTWRVDLRDLHLSFDAPTHGWEPLATRRDRGPERDTGSCLSWGSSTFRPSTDAPSARPLPEAEASFGPTAPPVSARVPPSWFLTTSTVSSAQRLRVCCTPLPVWGSPRFATPPPGASRKRHRRTDTVPRDAG
jgi:hypothetical protein